MRTLIRSGLIFSLTMGAALVALHARADGGLTDSGIDAGTKTNCDPNTLWCSNGQAPQKVESKDRLPIGIDTGWMPSCPGNPNGHCSDHKIQVRAQIAFDPLKNGQPIFSIDMPAKSTLIDARWPTVDNFELSLPKGATKDGTFKVAHTLTPEFVLYLDTPVFTGEIKLDANILINYIPGAQFNYAAMNSEKFIPWGFDKVDTVVKGTDMQNSKLFEITFEQLGKIVNINGTDQYVKGSFSFNATTNSTFSYQSTKVVVLGSNGPIPSQTGTTLLPQPYEDAIDMSAHAEGMLRYSGYIELLPVINITEIAGFSITLSFPISVGLKFPYDSGSVPVVFPNSDVHIPIPNIYIPTMPIDFGTVATGQKMTKTVTVENTGELGGLVVGYTSSDPQFKGPTKEYNIAPGDSADIEITFRPQKGGTQQGKLTIKTNDPDTPEWIVPVKGKGEGPDVGPDPEDDAGTGSDGGKPGGGGYYYNGSNNDSGCGCRTASTESGLAVSSLAALGLALALLRRIRRS